MKKKVLVFGGDSQLAHCIKKLENEFSNLDVNYLSSSEGDVTCLKSLETAFSFHEPSIVINCAAYTAVDLAEEEVEKATKINASAAGNLAKYCQKFDALLIQISTDFVFEGKKTSLLTEIDDAQPINIYGKTKLEGEKEIERNAEKYYILRTSWLYSEFGSNFVKTMIRLGKEKTELAVVHDQIGTPTYGVDLARVILKIAGMSKLDYGVYHYSNEGVASWYDFAHSIFEQANIEIQLKPLSSKDYITKAARPSFSVMDKSKIKKHLNIKIPHWRDSLGNCLKVL